jgi:hypothetical protein
MVRTPLAPCIVVVYIANRVFPRKRSQKSISFRTGTSRSTRTHTPHDTPSIQWEANSIYGVSHDIQAFNSESRDGVRRGCERSMARYLISISASLIHNCSLKLHGWSTGRGYAWEVDIEGLFGFARLSTLLPNDPAIIRIVPEDCSCLQHFVSEMPSNQFLLIVRKETPFCIDVFIMLPCLVPVYSGSII